ncbi:MAG: DUF393 domain-containing protein [Armatimonadetes bacterium]|nr:DUF393 domain-containing protein [Armatimonadota bacterium]
MSGAKREPLLILFDGECNLCNGVVQFLVRHDADGSRFRFAAQQSEAGQRKLADAGYTADGGTADTLLVFAGDKLLERSDAALELTRFLPAPYPLLLAGKIVPRFLRDGVYRWIAKNRYQWFGKRNECMMPTAELRARFLS